MSSPSLKKWNQIIAEMLEGIDILVCDACCCGCLRKKKTENTEKIEKIEKTDFVVNLPPSAMTENATLNKE